MTEKEQQKFLKATPILEVNHKSTFELISTIDTSLTTKQQAIALYNKVRDGFVYNPYHLDLRSEKLKSSVVLQKSKAWCVEKSIVLATGLRALGIPSKLGYGIVVNHIGVEKLTAALRREEIVFHGYVSAFLEGKWVKCTPAFDPLICKLSGVEALAWDGENDSLFQAYQGNQKFMEYKHFYGEFDDVPVELMNAEMQKYYPHLFEEEHNSRSFSFFHINS
ncbi:transglutaminase-like domain-containing protein [Brumimicrobium mesophilum]|uniref:transglutaminase-like domain-containing protein n=1 Tax=Brumimicrobium mesophilum TaxID=392717 RepID=UPI000D1421B7|nr:transglutaminase-like domain-containing protein [Brumimicrobium mesophilum]